MWAIAGYVEDVRYSNGTVTRTLRLDRGRGFGEPLVRQRDAELTMRAQAEKIRKLDARVAALTKSVEHLSQQKGGPDERA